MRGKFQHTSNFGVGPSDVENFNTLASLWTISCVTLWEGKGSRAGGEGCRGWSACICLTGSPLQERPSTIPQPAAKAKEQEVPQIAQKILVGKISALN